MNRIWNVLRSVKNVTYNTYKTIYNYVTKDYEKQLFEKNKELKHAKDSLNKLNKDLTKSRLENAKLIRKNTKNA